MKAKAVKPWFTIIFLPFEPITCYVGSTDWMKLKLSLPIETASIRLFCVTTQLGSLWYNHLPEVVGNSSGLFL